MKWYSHFGRWFTVPQIVKHEVTTWLRNSTLRYIPKRIENLCLQKNLYPNVHSIIIYTNQKGKTTQVPISWWMNEQDVVYPYHEIIFTIKGNEVLINATTWMNLEIMLSERNQKSDAKGYKFSDSICMKCPQQANP